jgi:hypothetical protein
MKDEDKAEDFLATVARECPNCGCHMESKITGDNKAEISERAEKEIRGVFEKILKENVEKILSSAIDSGKLKAYDPNNLNTSIVLRYDK